MKNTVKFKKLGICFATYSVTNPKDKTTTKTVSVEVMKGPVFSFNLIYKGNLMQLDGLDSGKAQIVYIAMENADFGLSNILGVELPKTPSGPDMNKAKPEKPKQI